ncbi:MAG: VanZ family protein [Chloroflexota bacterium]
MSTLSSMELNSKDSQSLSLLAHARTVALFLLLAIFCILYLTLFPFDFFAPDTITLAAIRERFEFDIFSYYVLSDFPRNVLLFVPFGFGLGLWWRRKNLLAVVTAALFGLLLSLSIEIIQALFLLRFAAVADLLANAVGAVGGIVLYGLIGDWFWRVITAVYRHPYTRPLLLALAVAYLAGLLATAYQLRQAVEPTNWSTEFPLLLGNEQTGDRPWAGEITTLYATNRALTNSETARLLNVEDVATIAGSNLMAHYQPTAASTILDQSGNLPPLRWQGTGLNETAHREPVESAVLNEQQWLMSEAPSAYWAEQVRQTGELTVGLVLRSHDLTQAGPARIVSISNDPFQRNLMIGQAGQDLIIRLRTPFMGENGRSPEFVIPNALTNHDTHHIIVSYGKTAVRVNIQSNTASNHYQLALSPAFTLFWTLPHVKAEQFRLGSSGTFIYTLLYSLLFVLPILLIIRLALHLPQAKPALKTRHVS